MVVSQEVTNFKYFLRALLEILGKSEYCLGVVGRSSRFQGFKTIVFGLERLRKGALNWCNQHPLLL